MDTPRGDVRAVHRRLVPEHAQVSDHPSSGVFHRVCHRLLGPFTVQQDRLPSHRLLRGHHHPRRHSGTAAMSVE